MRFSQLVALLTPLIAQGNTQSVKTAREHITTGTALPHLEPDLHADSTNVTFEVPCEADDEAFLFTFQVAGRIPLSTPCVETQITLNDKPVIQEWAVKDPGLTGYGDIDVSSKSAINDLNHQLDLAIRSDCDPQSGTGPNPITDPYSDNGHVLQSTVIKINRIDGKVPKSDTSFTVTLNASKAKIIKVVAPDRAKTEQTSSKPPPHPKSRIIKADTSDRTEAKQSSSEALSVPSSGENPPDINHENQRLQALEGELQKLRQAVDGQKAYVEHLLQGRTSQKCPIQAIVDKAKGCAHKLLRKITPNRKPTSGHDDCKRGHSRQFSMLASWRGEKKCDHVTVSSVEDHSTSDAKTSTKTGIVSEISYEELIGEHQNTTRSSGFSSSGPEKHPYPDQDEHLRQGSHLDPQHHSHDAQEYLLLALGILTSILCLSCVTTKLHHRCCNPRAQAERLARREERQTRRQYKCLARRQAWRQWWDRRLHRNTVPSSSDYEEKRSLIMAQEGILESAMQDEINRLRHAHGYPAERVSAAEEGRAFTESLPPYRSRAGSGRPPSYTSDSNDATSITIVTSVTSSTSDAGDMSPVRDSTPDSSVMSLSPRHSSETLRTERSVV